MADTKHEIHYSPMTEYAKEESYLAQKHREGWRLAARPLGIIHRFARCQPEDAAYRLDFRPLRGEDEEAYMRPYREHGWEAVQDAGIYRCFRKPAALLTGEDEALFTAPKDRLLSFQRILRIRMLVIAVIILFMLVPQIRDIMANGLPSPGILAVCAVWYAVLLAFTVCHIRDWIGYYRLMKAASAPTE